MQLTINQKQYDKITDAKVRGFWANPKGLTDFLIRLLRQGGRFATKGRKGLGFCRKGIKKGAPPSPKTLLTSLISVQRYDGILIQPNI